MFALEPDLSVESLDEGCVAIAGKYAAQFLDAQAPVEFCIPALRHVEVQNAFVLIQNVQLQRVVSAPGLNGSCLGLQIVPTQASGEFPTLPACNPGNNIPDDFQNLVPSKPIAQGIHDGR